MTSVPPQVEPLYRGGAAGYRLVAELPPGRLVTPENGGPAPYWLSDEPVDVELFRRLRAQHSASGLWPVLADGLEEEPGRPWQSGEVEPEAVEDIDRHDAATVMRGVWTEWLTPEEDEEALEDAFEALEPFGMECPGLAAPGQPMASPDEAADWAAGIFQEEHRSRLLLAKVSRSADLPAVVGWGGPMNHSNQVAPLAAMLRSWEERFGIRVVRIGFDTLDVSVAAPPVTEEHALHVAAEHWAFCPDNIDQGPGTLREYAGTILKTNTWSFWWD